MAESGARRAGEFRHLPKVDLHVHLEGSLSRALLRRIAPRQGAAGLRAHDLAFHDFDGFLRAFAGACSFLRRPLDFQMAVQDMGRRFRRDGVIHAEVFFSPQIHTRRGLRYADLATALEQGARQVEAAGGPSLLFIADGVRQWGVESFQALLADLERHPSPFVVGIGLGGMEEAIPSRAFAPAFAAARACGLAAVVHAGETGPPAGVLEAVELLGACRVGHGVAAGQDGELLRWLRLHNVTLDVCLSSNRRTGVWPAGRPHPLAALVGAGVPVTLGSDDPALFRTTLSREYARAAACGLEDPALRRVAGQAARASLLPSPARLRLLAKLEAAWRVWRPADA
jgi:adenosine deaminase